MGILFSLAKAEFVSKVTADKFSSPCVGILFSRPYYGFGDVLFCVVFSSPCVGILFSLAKEIEDEAHLQACFRPHVWGFFFHGKSGSSKL